MIQCNVPHEEYVNERTKTRFDSTTAVVRSDDSKRRKNSCYRVDRVQVTECSLVKEMGLVINVHERTILVPEVAD